MIVLLAITVAVQPLQAVKELMVPRGIPAAIFAVTRNSGYFVISTASALTRPPAVFSASRYTPVSGRFWPLF